MANSVQSLPEYQEIRDIVQNMVVEVERIVELVWEIILRGNVSITGNVNMNFLCFVITCIMFHDSKQYIN
jgi:hypothetical protein